MWIALLLVSLAVAGGTVRHDGPWTPNTEYTYQIYSKTFTGIPALRQQYAAVVSRGQLVIQTDKSVQSNVIVGQLLNYEHASYNGDWQDPFHQHQDWMNDAHLEYQSSSLNKKPFQLQLVAGTVENIEVDSSMTNDEVNQLKAILSQLQVDFQGHNLIQSVHNQLPDFSARNDTPAGLYYTMEPSFTGQCQVTYEVSPLAAYTAPYTYPHWDDSVAPGSGEHQPIFQIVKTTDYSNCDVTRGFHHGLSGWNKEYNTRSNHIGDVLSRSTVSQIVAAGTPADFVIQYVQTTMRVSAAPELIQKQTALTTGNVELILTKALECGSPLPAPSNAHSVGNLVYRYDIPSDVKNQARVGPNSLYHGSASSGSDSQYNSDPFYNPSAFRGNFIGQNASPQSAHDQSPHHDRYWQPVSDMDQPPQHPFLPYFVGHQGHAIYHDVDVAAQIKALAVHIDQLVAQTDRIPHENVLQNFNILGKLIGAASLANIHTAAQALKDQQGASGSNGVYGPWGIFRDAVAVAGTGPASQAIVQAISSGQMAGKEAIAVLVIQPKVIVTPTRDLVAAYLKMMQSETVTGQPEVYWTAVLTLAEIIGRSYSDHRYAQNFYPVDSYGHFSYNLSDIVYDQVIPYYTQIVDRAFESGNERDILSSVRAYGNLGHASYLAVFKKYYENPVAATPFQRAALVRALDYLAVSHSSLVHPILYKIYQNVAEHPDVRTVAVLHLLFTNPDSSTWQGVASFTHQDPSVQVQRVVKYAIENMAQLKGVEHEDVVQRARAAQPLLSRQLYQSGDSHSYSAIYQNFVDNLNYARYRQACLVGKGNSAFPKYLGLRTFTNAGGLFKSYGQYEHVVSNVRGLLRHFARSWQQTGEGNDGKAETIITDPENFHFDNLAANVPLPPGSEELVEHVRNIVYLKSFSALNSAASGEPQAAKRPWYRPSSSSSEQHDSDSFQGQFEYPYFGGQRYHAFDQSSMHDLPATIQNVVESYKDGRSVSFRKFYKDDTMTIAFPLVTGYPYVYTWDSPVLVQAHGTVQIQTSQPVHQAGSHMVHIPEAVNFTTKISFTYSRDHITQAGFVTPFSGRHYVAGHVRKVMYNVPLNVDVDVDLLHGSVSGALMLAKQDTVAHFSSSPYTVSKDAFSLTPDTTQSSGAQLIHTRPMKQINRQVGYNTHGLVFHISGKYETPRDIQGPIPYLVGGVPQSNPWLAFQDPTEGVEAYKVNVKYDPQNSQADGIRFGFATKSGVIRNRKPQQGSGSGKSSSSYSSHQSSYPSFQQSIDELFEKVTPKIANGYSTVVQGWLALVGHGHQSVYQAFGAYTTSRPEGIYRVSAGFRKNEHSYSNAKEYCLDMGVVQPGNQQYALNSINDTLQSDRQVAVDLRLTVGNDCTQGQHNPDNTNLIGVGLMNQTDDYVNYVLHSVEAQQCQHDYHEGNYQSPACRWVIRQLRLPNALQFNIQPVGSEQYVPDMLKFLAWTQSNYIVRDYIHSLHSIQPISGQVFLSPDNQYYDGTVKYGEQEFDIHDYQTGPIVRSVIFGQHPFFKYGRESIEPHNGECVVDRNYITTFDQAFVGRSVGRCLYVAVETLDDHVHSWASRSQIRNVTVLIADESGLPYNRQVGIQFYTDKAGNSYLVQVRGRGMSKRPSVALWINENVNKVQDNKHTEVVADGVVRMHIHPQTGPADNMVVVDVHDASMRVIFDGETLRIQTDASYEQRVRGLCGTNDQESFNDRQSPDHCVYRNETYFVESWAIPDSQNAFCHSDVKRVRGSSKYSSSCYPIEYIPDAVVNEYEANIGLHNPNSNSPSLAFSGPAAGGYQVSSGSYGPCVARRQIQQVKIGDQTCFTSEPLPACPQGCRPSGLRQQRVSAQCYNSQDPMARLHQQSIAKGHDQLKWGENAVSRTISFNVPTSCNTHNPQSNPESSSQFGRRHG